MNPNHCYRMVGGPLDDQLVEPVGAGKQLVDQLRRLPGTILVPADDGSMVYVAMEFTDENGYPMYSWAGWKTEE